MKKLLPLILLCACQKEPVQSVPCYACTTTVTTYKLNGIVSTATTVNTVCHPDSAKVWATEQAGRDTNLMGWVTVKETICNQSN
jgi:hypothetical protein